MYKPKHDRVDLSERWDLPIYNQGNRMNCTALSFASVIQHDLSNYFHERTLIDVDDLWDKQKKYGTATEEYGDYLEGPWIITERYGVKFKTESGIEGMYYLSDKIIINSSIKNG